jgi:chemosensory pili system protein ChpA (sensor histidine kinase/response regulator)
VGLPTAALVLRACESALHKLTSGRPIRLDAKHVEIIEQAAFALLDYLSRLLTGKPVSPLALFPQYREVQELAGADRIHPADLWPHDWQWREVAADANRPRVLDAALRSEVETLTLQLMRQGGSEPALALSSLFASLAAGSDKKRRHVGTLWHLAAAFFEAQGQRLLVPDVYSKRIASRLLSQLRMSEHTADASALPDAGADVSQRLAQDLLFFCAQAASPGDGRKAPRLLAVRQAWNLGRRAPVDYLVTSLGRHDPAAIAQARKRVAAAKDSWAAIAGSELHRLAALNEQFALVGESLRKLYPAGDQLGAALSAAAAQTTQSGAVPPPALAMEVATAVLFLEASLEDGDFDHPAQAERVQRLAARIGKVGHGSQPEPLEPWMEELYRRVSDRQTMGSVVQELKAALADAEKAIDQFFRDASKTELLHPVPAQLNSMRGVFSVLGLDHASHAVVRMRDDVDRLIAHKGPDDAATERLAVNLGALGFLIDMLNVQPAMAKSLFAFDARSGQLRAVVATQRGARISRSMGLDTQPAALAPVEPRLIEQAQSLAIAAAHPEVPLVEVRHELDRLSNEAMVADQPVLAETMQQVKSAFEVALSDDERRAVREELAQAMTDFVHSTTAAALDEIPQATRPLPLLPAEPTPAGQTGLEDDAEMRDIFLEEAREVIGNANSALGALADTPDDVAEMTTVRRAFHTLKGSARMVGLAEFGEAGWVCEQLYNARLAEQPVADAGLLALTADILAYMGDWVDAIGRRRNAGHTPAEVTRAIERWRASGEHGHLALPGSVVQAAAAPTLGAVSRPMALEGLLSDEEAASIELVPASGGAVLPLEQMLAPEAPVAFEIDLGDAARFEAGGANALQALATPEREAGAPAPDVSSALMSLEFVPSTTEVAPTIEPVAIDASAAAGPMSLADAQPPQAQTPPEPAFRMIGTLRVAIPLFNIFLNEADEQSRRLGVELAEWAHEYAQRPVGDGAIALAHSLAGNSATVGYTDLSHLARLLEHALMRSNAIGEGDADEVRLFNDSADEIRRLLHQFAAGFLRSPQPALIERLVDHERVAAERARARAESAERGEAAKVADVTEPGEARVAAIGTPVALGQAEFQALAALPEAVEVRTVTARADALDGADDIDAVDAIDAELFPIFQDEAAELLPQLANRMRAWAATPGDAAGAAACMRTLHTLKGGARLAGAMRLGEMAHRLETAIEHLTARDGIRSDEIEGLLGRVDALGAGFDQLLAAPAAAADAVAPSVAALPAQEPVATPEPAVIEPAPNEPVAAVAATGTANAASAIDWRRFALTPTAAAAAAASAPAGASAAQQATVRVRAPLLDRLVNHAGEVSIARSRIEVGVGQMKGSLGDLTENLERLRAQLRDIELQAESQIASRMEAAKAEGANFDPLEMDRFTRFQELTRMMAESVNDVATVQRGLQRTLQSAEDDLAAQARLTRDLQDDLLRTRMVEFESLSDRLYRVARQAAKELYKQVRLDIVGGSIEVDRGVLERMGGAFEHLLRNCVTHGIELPAERERAGKEATGQITITVQQEGNEIAVDFRDDGAGLNLARIRDRGVAMGLLAADAQAGDAELANLIFTPGFSTADSVTELAGRGIGMDVVRNDVNALGGRIETASAPGQGTSFRLVLPLTTAVTQVVMLRAGALSVAVPATLVDIVRRVPAAEVGEAYRRGTFGHGEQSLPFFWFGALLQGSGKSDEPAGRTLPIVVIKSAAQRVALHVDEVVGSQEVVVKNLGAQLARLPGLAGITLLASGLPALIYNPVALATLYGPAARAAMQRALQAPAVASPATPLGPASMPIAPPTAQAPLVLVVDDSLTVRRVTQRLLVREGYRVTTAKDGLDALEKLAEETPLVVLSDIEMPRMDGFDLARNLRADARWAGLPIIMITSRIAQKHREHAQQLGVNHYLGKPYSEDDLIGLVARYAGQTVAA